VVKSEEDLRETPGAEIFDKWFMIAVLLAPHTQDPNEDLDLIRFAGARYIAANKPQRGRDFAEHALQITYGTPERRRLAWLAFADIYDRSKSFNEALLGISCALAVPVPIDIDQLYQEATLLIRIYRDIHFTQYAADLTSWLLQMCEDFNLGERYKLRLKTLELQLRVLEAQRQSENASEQLQRLTTELAGHCRDLAKVGEDTAPATVFLAHCVQLCSGRGISVGEEVRETFEKNLATIPSATAAMIQISNQASARGADLLKVAQSIELARNAEDIAFDLLTFAIACRRFLDSGIDGDSIESAAFVIEALSDHALKESLVGTKDSPFESIGRSLAMAIDLSLRGMNVIMVGLSERGTLVRLSVMDGTVKLVREPEEIFSEKKYRAWTDHYPYGYAMIGDPLNLYYVTLTGIGLRETGYDHGQFSAADAAESDDDGRQPCRTPGSDGRRTFAELAVGGATANTENRQESSVDLDGICGRSEPRANYGRRTIAGDSGPIWDLASHDRTGAGRLGRVRIGDCRGAWKHPS
jgi:hypothetical protein